jgi:hypothetical protein
MGTLQGADIATRPLEGLDLTSLTTEACRELVPPFDAACQAPMAAWRLDGRPRTARRYTASTNCPLPTPAERRLCILVDLQTHPLHVVQGRLFGLGQRQAHQGMHGRLVVRRATLRALGEAPTRSVQALAPRLGVAEADAAAVVGPPPASPPPGDPAASAPPSPRAATTGPTGVSRAPRIRLSNGAVIAARNSALPCKTCG